VIPIDDPRHPLSPYNPDNPDAHLFVREPWRPWREHEFDRRYRDIELIVIPDGSDRIHRIVRHIAPDGVVHQSVLEVIQDVYTWREDDTTMVSIRFISRALGLDVDWNSALGMAIVDRGGMHIEIMPGRNHIWVGNWLVPVVNAHGEPMRIPVLDGRIFLPLNTIAYIFNLPTRWNEYTQTAYLYIVDARDFARFEYPEFDIDIVRVPINNNDIHNLTRRVEADVVSYDFNFDVLGDVAAWVVAETGTTVVPLRWMAYAMGFDIVWESAPRAAVLDPSGHNLRFTAGSTYMYVNGRRMPILDEEGQPMAATLVNGRMFVPLRALSDALQMPMGWNVYTNTAYLYIVRRQPWVARRGVFVNGGFFDEGE